MTGIEMPMQLKDIPRFERQNDVSISVYGWKTTQKNKDGEEEPGFAYPLHNAQEVKPNHVNLLMIGDDVKHYCWVKHFSRLISAQYTASKNEHAYCHYCLHGFYGIAIEGQCTRLEDAKRRRDDHEKECFRHGGQKTSFPKDPCVKFEAMEKQVRDLPFLFLISSNQIKFFWVRSR